MDALKARIEEYLLCDQAKTVITIKEEILGINNQFDSIINEGEEFAAILDAMLSKIVSRKNILQNSDIVTKYNQYYMMQTEYKLILVAQSLHQLQRFESIKSIPELILAIFRNMPVPIPTESKIYAKLLNTTTKLKATLLSDFHGKFSKHLFQNQDANNPEELWTEFLSNAKEWLLAYTMIFLLPYTFTDTTLIIEKYKECLDLVLTPLWGRFHFHLSSSRETQSPEQLLWTYKYAHSFVNLLANLCTQITSSNELQALHPSNYKTAALFHITDKATRFIRNHLAQLIVNNSPISIDICQLLVDCSLDLDEEFLHIYPPSLHIITVISDAPLLLQQWLVSDHQYIHHTLKLAYLSYEKVFDNKFTTTISTTSTSAANKRYSYCFSGLYDSIFLFNKFYHRYVNLPTHQQVVFSAIILEPLLLICVANLLYFTRTNLVLKQLSRSLLPFWQSHQIRPIEISNVLESIRYFQVSLSQTTTTTTTTTTISIPKIRTKRGRFERQWKFCKIWIADRVSSSSSSSISSEAKPEELVDFVFNMRDIQSIISNTNDSQSLMSNHYDDSELVELDVILLYAINLTKALGSALVQVFEDTMKLHSDI